MMSSRVLLFPNYRSDNTLAAGAFSVKNLDLPRKVKYKISKSHPSEIIDVFLKDVLIRIFLTTFRLILMQMRSKLVQ